MGREAAFDPGEKPPLAKCECPTCGVRITVGLPKSAGQVTVTETPAERLEERVDAGERFRYVVTACQNGHRIHWYFEW